MSMSQINFFAEHEAPLPKEEMRILNVRATAYPDRQRLRVAVEVSPFLERPNLLLLVHDEHDEVVGEASVIATMHANMEFTLHLRHAGEPAGAHSLTVELFYETRQPPQDRWVEGFVIPAITDETPSPTDEAST